MTADARSKQCDFWFERHRLEIQAILEQNGVVQSEPLEFCGKQSKRDDGGQIHTVLHSDQLCFAIDFEICRWIDFVNVQVFVNRLWLYIVFGPDFGRDLVPRALRDDDADQLLATTFDIFIEFDLRCLATLEVKWIEGKTSLHKVLRRIRKRGNLGEQIAAHGDFMRRIFGERDADGVAQAVAQQRTDAYGAFDAAVLAFARFGHTKVNGIIPIRAELVQQGAQPGGDNTRSSPWDWTISSRT